MSLSCRFFTIFIIVILSKSSQGLDLLDPVNTVWTTVEDVAELECEASNYFQWCYWEHLSPTPGKYYHHEWSNSSESPIVISKTDTTCKLSIKLSDFNDDLDKVIGDWKCHLANTDDAGEASIVENIMSLHLAMSTELRLFLEYQNESGMDVKTEVLHSTTVMENPPASNNDELISEKAPLYLYLIAGREVKINCDPINPEVLPTPKISLWFTSTEDEEAQLVDELTTSSSFIPQISDNGKRFICISHQKNDYINLNTIKRTSPPIQILSIPKITSYPTKSLTDNPEGDFATFSVTFFSQPPPVKEFMYWSFNEEDIISPDTSLSRENTLIAKASDIQAIESEDASPSNYKVDLQIPRESIGAGLRLSVFIANRLGGSSWSFGDSNNGAQPMAVLGFMSVSSSIVVTVVILLLLNLLMICVWCTCCCACSPVCLCCSPACLCCRLCPFLKKKSDPSDLDNDSNFYVILQNKEELYGQEATLKKNHDIVTSNSFSYEEEPSPNKDMFISKESHWMKLKSLDDTQVSLSSQHDTSDVPYKSPSQNSTFKFENVSPVSKSSPSPPAIPPKTVKITHIQSSVESDSKIIYVEVKDKLSQTSIKLKKPQGTNKDYQSVLARNKTMDVPLHLKESSSQPPDYESSVLASQQSSYSEPSPQSLTSPPSSKNYVLTGATSFPVPVASPSGKVYSDFMGSALDRSWIPKKENEES